MNVTLSASALTEATPHAEYKGTVLARAQALCFCIPSSDLPVFAALADPVKLETSTRLAIMENIARHRNAEAGFKEIRVNCGISHGTLRRWWFNFKRDGWRALVPCNREGCTRASLFGVALEKPGTKISHEFKQWFIALAERNQRKTKPAHRQFQKLWRAGETIPGLDNSLPRHVLPPGCSYGNLAGHCSDQFALAAMRNGLGRAMALHGPKVLTTRVGLWPMSHVMIDDLWHDHFVLFRGTPVRVLEFDAIEILSGCKIGWGTKPRLPRDDGTMEGLQEKFVRMLLARIFFQHGYSPRGTTIFAEHGTAAVREALEKLLHDRTGGKICVRRSGITGREQAVKGIFPGRGGGNPRFKSALESLRNLIHNELAALPGQTGRNTELRPESLHGELTHNSDLLKAIAVLAETRPERAALIQLSLLEYHAQFLPLLGDVYETINRRDWHTLEGWAKCGHVVNELNDAGVWTNAEGIVPAKREALLALARVDKGYARTRQLSPREVFNRGADTLTRLPAFVVAEILGNDFAREEKCANTYFEFQDQELDPEPLVFESRITNPEGREIELAGDTYQVFVNPFDLNQLFVHDARGRHLGIARRVVRTSKADDAGLVRQFGHNNKRLADLLKPIRARHAAVTRDAAKRDAHNADVIGGTLPEDKQRARELRRFTGDIAELAETDGCSVAETPLPSGGIPDEFSAEGLL